ncbi:MAG: DUF1566 domain-containing protein [Thermodesulfovibrionales bacterium]
MTMSIQSCFRNIVSAFSITILLAFAVTRPAHAFLLPDTGQTKCYDVAGAETVCAETGQNGAYTINLMSYTDNGDGTVTDNNTGLVWQKQDDGTKRTWDEANTYCDNLVLGGASDWRVPTKEELIGIVDYSVNVHPAINSAYFPDTSRDHYWSSSTHTYFTNEAWFAQFYSGYVDGESKTTGNYVRCARAGEAPPHNFVDNGGMVTDTKTGLIWQTGESGSLSWDDALSYCEGLTLGGNSDWRLPNIKELESIVDDTRYNPAINSIFWGTSTEEYWSSTTGLGAFNAWYVNFLDGFVRYASKNEGSHVRCVRGTNNCAATLNPNDLSMHIPVLDFAGSSYWLDFNYVAGLDFAMASVGWLTDTTPYSNCAHSTLSETNLDIHVPTLMFSGYSFWVDFMYQSSIVFTLISVGGN